MNRKLCILIALIGLFALPTQAQFTQVSATVTDPAGIPYVNGTVTIDLVVPGGTSATLNGAGFTGSFGPIGMDTTGSFIARLADNNVVLPAGTQWKFNVCMTPGTPAPVGQSGCFSVTTTVTGATQSLSATLNASALPLSRLQASGSAGSTLNCNSSAGSDFSTKVNNCINALPVNGGVADATGMTTTTFGPALTISKSNVQLRLPTVGTGCIGGSANPMITVTGNNVEILGFGDATTVSPARGSCFLSFGANTMLSVGDGIVRIRGFHIAGVEFYGNSTATIGMRLRNNGAGDGVFKAKFERLEFNNFNGPCIDMSDGAMGALSFDQIRMVGCVGNGFTTGTPAFSNGLTQISNSFASGVTGAPGIGWNLAATEAVLTNVDGEASVIGIRVGGGNVAQYTMNGIHCEGANSTACFRAIGGDQTTISGFTAGGEVLPIDLQTNSIGSTTIINPLTTATSGANSINVAVGATGNNVLIGGSGLDKAINVSGNLQRLANNAFYLLGPAGGTTFAILPSDQSSGIAAYCLNCNESCTAATGAGGWCFRQNGAWKGTLSSNANCSSSASPAACGNAAAGSVVIAAAATSVQVNTGAVTANSQIDVQEDQSLGTKLGVTCNTGFLTAPPVVSARTAGSNFTITISAALAVNPVCFSYKIIN